MNRDPRIDPKPGDVLLFSGTEHHVRSCSMGHVTVDMTREGAADGYMTCSLERWALMAEGAKVLNAAD